MYEALDEYLGVAFIFLVGSGAIQILFALLGLM